MGGLLVFLVSKSIVVLSRGTRPPPNSIARTKFMQMVTQEIYRRLEENARARGVSVQELVRAIVIPDWLAANP